MKSHMSNSPDPMLETTPSRPPSPGRPHDSTVEEIELKLKDLEFRVFGKEVPKSEASPFTPHSSLEKRIRKFKETLSSDTRSMVSAKLPPVPLPVFDGTDLESFLKDF